ncbi:PD40 domain-containing protein [Flavisolibacter tropicus]|nr:PD40 domain-containing protein [Flavisolibacter tropicus]
MKLKTTARLLSVSLMALLLTQSACTQSAAWKGKLVHGFSGSVNVFDFATKTDKAVFKDGSQPYVAKDGDIFFLSEAFPKRNVLIRKSTPTFSQFKDVLDMSSDNPEYKDALANYSVINGTGISAILSRMQDPKVSPDGKYVSVTIFGYRDQAFKNNCVAVFDRASQKLVAKFDNKYYGNWTPDGRLVMSGSHKTESTDGSPIHSKEPGIFITDNSLGNVKRIDPELDDPAPYHATVSPDGKRVAFIMNNHVWAMNIDGSNLKQLTDVDRDNVETYPAWSPDGKFVACWAYKTFERSYYTAIAIVSSNTAKPIALSDKAAVWPKDTRGYRVSGGNGQFSWR